MVIQNVSGRFYNEDNDVFGPEQVATEYRGVEDLPDFIYDGNVELELEVFSTEGQGGFLDARYFDIDDDDPEGDALASVVA
jgi:hypothetical protein